MKEIIQKISPNSTERKAFQQAVKSFLKKIKLKSATVILGGSGAKDTWLSGSHDVDVYISFDYKKFKNKSDQLSELLYPLLKKSFPKVQRLHGSRDYFQVNYDDFIFEIIPILNIKKSEEAVNITDVSLLHAKWVNKGTKKIKDEIRLTKQFCKANELYGAESYIQAFSGYVLEILTMHYGSFNNLLKASQKWRIKDIIDVEKHYPKKDALFHLNKSKQQSPLIIIDPVDKNRNAAAALSEQKFQLFRKLSKEYLKKPNIKFFERKKVDVEKIVVEAKKKNQHFLHLEVQPLKGKEDTVGCKLVKVFHFLEKELQSFFVKKSLWEWNKDAHFYFVLEKNELPEFEIRSGPPLKLKEYVKDFKKKNKDTFTEDGKISAKIKIKHPKLNDFTNDLIKNDYVKERVKKIKIV